MRKRIYRKKRLKDTSKRNLLIRADKRERFLAYSYIRGNFITFNNDNNAQIIEDYIYNIYK